MHRFAGPGLVGVLIALLAAPIPAEAAESQTWELNTSAQPLSDALKAVADRFELEIAFFSNDTEGLDAPPLTGIFSAAQAFDALLAGTALEHIFVNGTSVAIRSRAAEEAVTTTEPLARWGDNDG